MCTGLLTAMSCQVCHTVHSGVANATRVYYGMMLFGSTVLSTVLLSDRVSQELHDHMRPYWFPELHQGALVPAEVIGTIGVYRVMSGVCLFHLVFSGLLLNVQHTTDLRARLHNEGMGLTLLLYLGTIACMVPVPSEIFVYASTWPFKVGGAAFLLLQIMFLISFIYDIYEHLVERSESQARSPGRTFLWAKTLSLGLAIGGYLVTGFLSGTILLAHSQSGCPLGVVASGFNLILMCLVSVLSVSDYVRDASNGAGPLNSIFQSSLVSAYASYRLWTAFKHHPEEACHLGHHAFASTSVSVLLTFLSIVWSAVRSGSNQFLRERPTLPLSIVESDDTEVPYSYSQFHLIFSLASMYLANLLTGWGDLSLMESPEITPGPEITPSQNKDPLTLGLQESVFGVWIQVGSVAMCYGVYAWMMLAPPMYPDRLF